MLLCIRSSLSGSTKRAFCCISLAPRFLLHLERLPAAQSRAFSLRADSTLWKLSWCRNLRVFHLRSATIFLELPVPVVERTDLTRLEPAGNAVEVECMLWGCVSRALYLSIPRSLNHRLRIPTKLPRSRRLTLQIPQATVHSSLVALAWLAWQSIHRSMMWFLQMAQLSTTMSQAQSATAFHCAPY